MTQHEWEGDLPTEHLNRCELRDKLLYADILNDDGSHRVAWRCHKREGHDGPCSTHNDCGVMNGGVVCGMKPGHQGPHSWETRIHLSASRTPNEPTPALSQVVVDVIRRMRKFAATSDDSYAMETWADELEQALALSSVRTPETTPDDASTANCLDCGLDYDAFAMDTLLPRWQWLLIHPDEGGLLCANCIVKRAAKIPGSVGLHAIIGIQPPSAEPKE